MCPTAIEEATFSDFKSVINVDSNIILQVSWEVCWWEKREVKCTRKCFNCCGFALLF